MNTKRFTEDEQYFLDTWANYVEESHYEMRKGKAQNKYVIKVTSESVKSCGDSTNNHLIGYWIMSDASDLEYAGLQE